MKREEKNALSRRRIEDAALREFSQRGYEAASMNAICADNGISKGIIYHYFKDKDELYLVCATACYAQLAAHLAGCAVGETAEQKLRAYFDARLRFFADNPEYLGIFLDVTLNPPARLCGELAKAKEPFDTLNIRTLTELLSSAPLRRDVSTEAVAEDFRMYMDFFNARFRSVLTRADTAEQALREHEERCHRQLDILLHGVLEK